MSDQNTQDRIHKMVTENPIVLFMKGTPDAPQCGFSAVTSNILKDVGVAFAAFNVLSDQSVREGIKVYGSWPTIPQLYVHGELVGGCDIVRDLYEQGEIEAVLRGKEGAEG